MGIESLAAYDYYLLALQRITEYSKEAMIEARVRLL